MNLGIYGTGGLGKEIFDVACRENANIKKWESIIKRWNIFKKVYK